MRKSKGSTYGKKQKHYQRKDCLFETIRAINVRRYLVGFEKKGCAAQTVSTELFILRAILACAVMAGGIDVNPAVKSNWKDAEFGLFGLFLLYTEMRHGEALVISYSNIDRKKGVLCSFSGISGHISTGFCSSI